MFVLKEIKKVSVIGKPDQLFVRKTFLLAVQLKRDSTVSKFIADNYRFPSDGTIILGCPPFGRHLNRGDDKAAKGDAKQAGRWLQRKEKP